jgi:hypothetical protein
LLSLFSLEAIRSDSEDERAAIDFGCKRALKRKWVKQKCLFIANLLPNKDWCVMVFK